MSIFFSPSTLPFHRASWYNNPIEVVEGTNIKTNLHQGRGNVLEVNSINHYSKSIVSKYYLEFSPFQQIIIIIIIIIML